MSKCIFGLLLAIVLAACTSVGRETDIRPFTTESAMVVSAHPLASKIGKDILLKGGNAIDAAIATQFALAVVFPAAGNIGGGGFMVFRQNDGSPFTLDYREMAPSAATSNMFLDSAGNPIAKLSEKGHKSVGVPGSVAGMWEAHQKFGKLPWSELVEPAVELAREGCALTHRQAEALNDAKDLLDEYSTVSPQFLLKDWNAGDTIRWLDLAGTLSYIRDEGRAGFYEGKIANAIVDEMKRGAGLITHEDLRQYKPVWRKPLIGSYKGYKVISMGPPSSGGVALLQMLRAAEKFPIAEWGHNTVNTIHVLTEIERRVYADRAAYLGDPDFFDVPVEKLLEEKYISMRMQDVEMETATPSASIREGSLASTESHQTTHLSVVDKDGNAVSVTTTLNDWFGSGIVVGGAGFILNDEMDDFSVKPGTPNMYGVTGGEANKIEPRKRMLSSMTPTILEKDGQLFMVVGTPGGSTIMTSVLQTILNVVDHKMSMQEAVAARRFHSQWTPDVIYNERRFTEFDDSIRLVKMGHAFDPSYLSGIGEVDAILVRADKKLEAGADPRGDDAADGY